MTAYIPGLNGSLKDALRAIAQLGAGRSNGVGVVTLAASAASTTVTDPNCAVGTTIILSPSTAHAAAEQAAGTLFIPIATIANGSFVVQHANNTQTDRIFRYALVG